MSEHLPSRRSGGLEAQAQEDFLRNRLFLMHAIAEHRKANPNAYADLGLTAIEERAMLAALEWPERELARVKAERDGFLAAALHFEREYERLCDELQGTPRGYVTARGVLSEEHLRARAVLTPHQSAGGQR